MDDARRTQLCRCADDVMELVELEILDDDDARWWRRINAIAERSDGSLQVMVRMLSRVAAAEVKALSISTGQPVDTILTHARLDLLQDIESRWE